MLIRPLSMLGLVSVLFGLTSCTPLSTSEPTAISEATRPVVIPTTTLAPATPTALVIPTMVPPTAAPTVEASPVASTVSNFSETIAYLGPDPSMPQDGSMSHLLFVSASSGAAQKIGLDPSSAEARSNCGPRPAWSTDGRYLLVGRSGTETNPDGGLTVIDTQNQNAAALLNNVSRAVAWAPTQAEVYFTRPLDWSTSPPSGDQGIWVWTVGTGETRPLLPPWPDYAVGRLGVSPDGTRLSMHAASYEGLGQFALANLDGSALQRFDFPVGAYDWAPDSQWMVFDEVVYIPEASMPLQRMDRNGDNVQVFLELPDSTLRHPQFSPDGRTIAFINSHGLTPEGAQLTELWLVDADGQNPRPLPGTNGIQHFDWSPNGQALVAYNNQPAVYLVPLAGTPTLLGPGICPVWQPAPLNP